MGINITKISEYANLYGKRLIETKPYTSSDVFSYVTPTLESSLGLTKSMTKKEAVDMILSGKYKIKAFSAKDQTVDMTICGKNVTGKWIDGGGSKCAYRINLNNEDICVLLPHQNWVGVMNEPQNTIMLKKMGLLTNDYCKIIPVEVEGYKFPALISKPYDKHHFKIFDKKNPNDDLSKYYDLSQITENNIEQVFGDLIKDVKTVVDNNVHLGYDSFNLALKDGKLRLYFNDLPYETLIKEGNKTDLRDIYLGYMLDTVPSAISWHTIKNYPFLKSLDSMKGQDDIMPKLIEIYEKLK